jgi:hypothetical protein
MERQKKENISMLKGRMTKMNFEKIIDTELRKVDARLVLSATLFGFMALLTFLLNYFFLISLDTYYLEHKLYTTSYLNQPSIGLDLWSTHAIEYLLVALGIWILLNLVQMICEFIDSYKKKQYPAEVITIRQTGLILIVSGGIYLVTRILFFLDQPNIKFFDISFGYISLSIILWGTTLITFAPGLNNLAQKLFVWRLQRGG